MNMAFLSLIFLNKMIQKRSLCLLNNAFYLNAFYLEFYNQVLLMNDKIDDKMIVG